jgi:hypothetical protein
MMANVRSGTCPKEAMSGSFVVRQSTCEISKLSCVKRLQIAKHGHCFA